MSLRETDLIRFDRASPAGGGMTDLPSLVAAAEASIVDPSPAERAILAKLDKALARTEEGRLRVAMLGQFKRGKSTLLNALLGIPLLPTGITPVTAIPTYIRFAGHPSLQMEFDGGQQPLHSTDSSAFSSILARYVSESANPGNGEQVRGVEIAVNSAVFSDRVILIDTSGVGSTFLHNSRTAEAVLGDCDVGIFVVSADPPITEVELGYLDNIRRLIPKLYFVLNKVDLLSRDDRDVALSFLARVLEDKLPRAPRIFPMSATTALLAEQEGERAALAAPADSIIDASALAFVRFMPRALRERRLRRQIASDTERAALRNVANLDWTLRQNVENAFRRFESSLAEQLSEALEETRRAMQIALEKRSARSSEVGSLVAQTERSIAALTAALEGLQNADAG
jgi:tRNA U34 5-carboxymethylaminomethyl modifying GTPase MnmE/TrmE